jgi:thiosulfate dehydrogenase
MQGNAKFFGALVVALTLLVGMSIIVSAWADQFTKKDQDRWQQEFMAVVEKGEKLFHSPTLGKNKVSCDQCHPNGANTHPETYPKFQKQIGRVIALFEMINWCIQNPLEGETLAADDPKMVAIQAYIAYERRGVPLDPGRH